MILQYGVSLFYLDCMGKSILEGKKISVWLGIPANDGWCVLCRLCRRGGTATSVVVLNFRSLVE